MPTNETPSEKFRTLAQKLISVPKSEIDKREKEYKAERKRKKRKPTRE